VTERRVSASNSFTEAEVKILTFIFSTLQRGGDPRTATRNKAFGSLSAKVVRMGQRMEEAKRKRAEAELKPHEIPPESEGKIE